MLSRGNSDAVLASADTRPPKVVIRPLSPRTSNRRTTIRWTSDETARYLCAIDNSRAVDCGSGLESEWTTDSLSDGDHTFILTAIDPIGNRARDVRRLWTVGE